MQHLKHQVRGKDDYEGNQDSLEDQEEEYGLNGDEEAGEEEAGEEEAGEEEAGEEEAGEEEAAEEEAGEEEAEEEEAEEAGDEDGVDEGGGEEEGEGEDDGMEQGGEGEPGEEEGGEEPEKPMSHDADAEELYRGAVIMMKHLMAHSHNEHSDSTVPISHQHVDDTLMDQQVCSSLGTPRKIRS
jgi:hypothetical protein